MTDSDQQAWQRSPIGITMPSVNPRPGSARVQKFDVVGAPRPGINDKFQVLVPGVDHTGGLGAQLGASAVPSRVCSVCTRASADYSCPRCLIGYCSSKCYKAHGSQCTEAFFREHVERETRVEEGGEGQVGARERREVMMQLLRRVRESDKARQDVDYERFSENRVANILNSNIAENEPAEAEEHARLARERLEALSLALNARDPDEPIAQTSAVRSDAVRNSKPRGKSRRFKAMCNIGEGQGDISGSDDGRVLGLLTKEEKTLFLREVTSGRLGRLIVPWIPWWTQGCNVQEIHSGSSHPAVLPTFSSDSNSTASLNAQPPTPEEHKPIEGFHDAAPHGGIRREGGKYKGFVDCSEASAEDTDDKVERKNNREGCSRHTFSVLSHLANQAPRFSTLSARPPSPSLQALATDLAYAYVYTARLYNGCWCSDPVGASLALIGVSPVLRDGATPSTVEQALSASFRRAVESEGLGFRLYAESLRKDVVVLSSDHRKWLCAFEDAWGMLDAAVRSIESSEAADLGIRKKYQKRAAKELCKAEKRVGYFRSWALSYGERVTPAIAAAIAVSTFSDPRGSKIHFSADAAVPGVL